MFEDYKVNGERRRKHLNFGVKISGKGGKEWIIGKKYSETMKKGKKYSDVRGSYL